MSVHLISFNYDGKGKGMQTLLVDVIGAILRLIVSSMIDGGRMQLNF